MMEQYVSRQSYDQSYDLMLRNAGAALFCAHDRYDSFLSAIIYASFGGLGKHGSWPMGARCYNFVVSCGHSSMTLARWTLFCVHHRYDRP